MAANWLEEMMPRVLAKLRSVFPPRPLSPNLIFDVGHVRKAILMIEDAIKRDQKEIHDEGQSRLIKAAQNPFHDWIENPVFAPMAISNWNAHWTFPLILRRSLFISICSHTEHALRRWCELLHAEWKLPTKLTRVKDQSDIQSCMTYLRDVAKLPLGDFDQWPEWSHIDGYRVARNCLAHNGGIIERPADRVKVEVLTHMEVDESGLILEHPVVHVLPGACEAALDVVEAFFERLARAYQQHPRARQA